MKQLNNRTLVCIVYFMTTLYFTFKIQPVQAQSVNAETTGAFARIIRYEVKKDALIQFREALSAYVAKANAESNNILTEAYDEKDKPGVLWLIERWRSKKDLDQFAASVAAVKVNELTKRELISPVINYEISDLEPLTKAQWRTPPEEKDRPVVVMLFVDARPGTAAHFKEVYHTAMPAFRSEPGVINYQLSQFTGDSTRFVTYEKFRDDEAFEYHLKFPPIQPVIDYLQTSIVQQPFQRGLHTLIAFTPLKQQQQ